MLADGLHGQAFGTAEGDVGDGGGIDRAAFGVLRHRGTGDGGGLGVEAVRKMQTQSGTVYGRVDAVAEGLILEILGVIHADGGAGGSPAGYPLFGVRHNVLPRV